MPQSAILQWLRQVLSGLRYLHQKGVLHLDLKPENILFDSEGTARLGDFGVASVFDRKHVLARIGTAGYLSPELVRGAKCSEKSDVWSLGCVLYELCCGKVRFRV